MTRNSASVQIKALAMIVAIEGLIPDRRAGSSEKKSASQVAVPQIDAAAWLREQQGKRSPDLMRDKEGPDVPVPPPAAAAGATALSPAETPRRRLMPPCPLLFQTPGAFLYRKTLYLAPETLRETHCQCPKKPKKVEFYRTLQKSKTHGTLLVQAAEGSSPSQIALLPPTSLPATDHQRAPQ